MLLHKHVNRHAPPFQNISGSLEGVKYQTPVFPSTTKKHSTFTNLWRACKAFPLCLTAIFRQELKTMTHKDFSCCPTTDSG